MAMNFMTFVRNTGKIFYDKFTFELIKSLFNVESSFYEITDPE